MTPGRRIMKSSRRRSQRQGSSNEQSNAVLGGANHRTNDGSAPIELIASRTCRPNSAPGCARAPGARSGVRIRSRPGASLRGADSHRYARAGDRLVAPTSRAPILGHAGVSPRALASIVRFDAVYKRMRHVATGDYATLIQDHYFDQSHFLKAFKRYAGVTPRVYAESRDYGTLYIPDGAAQRRLRRARFPRAISVARASSRGPQNRRNGSSQTSASASGRASTA